MDEPQFNEHNKTEYPPMHTAEHIINQAMIRLFDCGRSVEAHIERKKSKLDYRLPAAPTDEQVKQLEDLVNSVVDADMPVTMEYITQQEAVGRFDLKRLPDGASENVRVVHVGDFDQCLCIGLHVEHTAEIGHVQIISYQYDEETHIWRMRFKLVNPTAY